MGHTSRRYTNIRVTPRRFSANYLFGEANICLEFSIAWGWLQIPKWSFHSCANFDANVMYSLRFSSLWTVLWSSGEIGKGKGENIWNRRSTAPLPPFSSFSLLFFPQTESLFTGYDFLKFNFLHFTAQVRLFSYKKGNLKFSDWKVWWRKILIFDNSTSRQLEDPTCRHLEVHIWTSRHLEISITWNSWLEKWTSRQLAWLVGNFRRICMESSEKIGA